MLMYQIKKKKVATENGCPKCEALHISPCVQIGSSLYMLVLEHLRQHCWIWAGRQDMYSDADGCIVIKLKIIEMSNIKSI